jgi:hypothetical protein
MQHVSFILEFHRNDRLIFVFENGVCDESVFELVIGLSSFGGFVEELL